MSLRALLTRALPPASLVLLLSAGLFANAQTAGFNFPPFTLPVADKTAPDSTSPAWRMLSIPGITPARFSLSDESGQRILEVQADKSAATLAASASADPASMPRFNWRWQVNRVVEKADLSQKSGDDFAARVYVFFDVPLNEVPFFDRMKILFARTFYKAEVPTAALCYVWDNQHAPDTRTWSPYTSRVRIIVLQSGNARAGQWVNESRDVAADFREAFGTAAPRITGIALGADTDQTGERVVARFAEPRFLPALLSPPPLGDAR
jgi:Protein of unknown function (DUF3047)